MLSSAHPATMNGWRSTALFAGASTRSSGTGGAAAAGAIRDTVPVL